MMKTLTVDSGLLEEAPLIGQNLSETETVARALMELKQLIAELRVQIIGPIRQEVLSGIREQNQFEKLRESLRDFQDIPLTTKFTTDQDFILFQTYLPIQLHTI